MYGGLKALNSDLTTGAAAPSTVPAAQVYSGRVAVPKKPLRIIAIGGGKGGIGKSMISSSLALTLAQNGERVVLFDADLGGANAHTCLGIPTPQATVADFVGNKVPHLKDVITPTGFTNLGLISGALDWMQAANPRPTEKARLGHALLEIDADVLVIDLGAGTGLHTIDFFLLAERGIVALIPEPTAIENAYRFIKMACIRRLQALQLPWYSQPLLARCLDERALKGLRSPAELLDDVAKIDRDLADTLHQELMRHPFTIVVNQVRDEEEARLAASIGEACRRFFGVAISDTISIPYDEGAWRAVRRRRPVVLEEPQGAVAASIGRLVAQLEPRA
jgi:flagellar biosynthesis protein FlhG